MRYIKNLLLISIITITFSTLNGASISRDKASGIARDWLMRNDAHREKSSARSNTIPALTHVRTGEDNSFYIFNRKGGGFVIVSGDDDQQPVLGYSYDDMWDDGNVPPFVEEILDNYVDLCKRGNGIFRRKESSESRASRGSLLHKTAKWSQRAPFNNLVAKGNPVGCTATAMAILLRYYASPLPGNGINSYVDGGKTYSFDFNRTFNWSAMPLEQPSGGYTESQAAAMAELSYACAVASYTSFSSGQSGATFRPFSLQKFFNYSHDVMSHNSSFMDLNSAKELLYDELDAGRLVICRGGAHCFVCDGYDNDYFHFNFGWGGSSDGYFSIGSLKPVSTGYPEIEFITGIHPLTAPQDNGIPWRIMRWGNNALGIAVNAEKIEKGGTYTFSITHLVSQMEEDRFEGEIGIALCNSNHEIKNILASQEINYGCAYYDYNQNFYDVPVIDDIQESDIIVAVGRPKGSESWSIIPVEKGLRAELSVTNTGMRPIPIVWDLGFANYRYNDFGANNLAYPGFGYSAYAEFPSDHELTGYIIDGKPQRHCNIAISPDDLQHIVRPVSFHAKEGLYGYILNSDGENRITELENKDYFIRLVELKVKGVINESDLLTCAYLPYITKLDLGDARIGGKKPNTIPDRLFKYNDRIEKVILPKTLTTLGSEAFAYSSVKSLRLGSDLKTIGSYALSSNAIEELIVEMPTPIPLYKEDISDIDLENAVLYVPKNKRTLYRNNYAWSYFKNIKEWDSSDVSDITSDSADIRYEAAKGVLSIHNSGKVADIELYRIDGIRILSDRVEGSKSYELAPGMYILKYSSNSGHKIIIP